VSGYYKNFVTYFLDHFAQRVVFISLSITICLFYWNFYSSVAIRIT